MADGSGDTSATVHFGGRIERERLLPMVRSLGGPVLVIGLDAQSIRRCEDLGFQLRQLSRVAAPELPLLVVTDSGALEIVIAFLASEQITARQVVAYSRGAQPVEFEPAPARPFVGLVNGDGQVLRGVSHPDAVIGVRRRSFAGELGLVTGGPQVRQP